MADPKEKLVPIPFPQKGLDLSTPFGAQPEGTTALGQNVRWCEALAQKDRGGSRSGLSKLINETVAGTHEIQDLDVVVVCLPPHATKGFILCIQGNGSITPPPNLTPDVAITLNGVALDTVVALPADTQRLAYMSASDAGLSVATIQASSSTSGNPRPTNGPPWTQEVFKVDGTTNTMIMTTINGGPVQGQSVSVWLFQLAWSGSAWSILSQKFQVQLLMGDGSAPGFPATRTLTWTAT